MGVAYMTLCHNGDNEICDSAAGQGEWGGLSPFGREVVPAPGAGAMSAISNVIWFLVAGLWLAIGHVTTAAAQAITIVGIPLAVANIKLIPVTCFPFGKQIVESS